ncbi:hypothetical protein H920_02829 [Fukomys damarensis]|uniref:Uncharacterized protein n=1 Tax=Fukomys damarensis TaxID=885580 RepID=A0A091EJR9_FUKDA|nr:hypothetical protein H920_02829 [Fukomys damarensis]
MTGVLLALSGPGSGCRTSPGAQGPCITQRPYAHAHPIDIRSEDKASKLVHRYQSLQANTAIQLVLPADFAPSATVDPAVEEAAGPSTEADTRLVADKGKLTDARESRGHRTLLRLW